MIQQYTIQATEEGIIVGVLCGRIHDNGNFVSWHRDNAKVFPPGMYGSVPGMLLRTAQDIASDTGLPFLGLEGLTHG